MDSGSGTGSAGSAAPLDKEWRAFEELFMKYQPCVKATINKYVTQHHEREELIQEVWLKIIRWWKKNRSLPQYPASWCKTVARHACLDFLARKKPAPMPSSVITELHEATKTAREQWDAEERKGCMLDALKTYLSGEELDILLMKYWQGKTYKEIGQDLQLTRDQVKYRLQKAIARLKEKISHPFDLI